MCLMHLDPMGNGQAEVMTLNNHIELTCDYCGKRFMRSSAYVANRRKWGRNRFCCSQACVRKQNRQDIGYVELRSKKKLDVNAGDDLS